MTAVGVAVATAVAVRLAAAVGVTVGVAVRVTTAVLVIVGVVVRLAPAVGVTVGVRGVAVVAVGDPTNVAVRVTVAERLSCRSAVVTGPVCADPPPVVGEIVATTVPSGGRTDVEVGVGGGVDVEERVPPSRSEDGEA